MSDPVAADAGPAVPPPVAAEPEAVSEAAPPKEPGPGMELVLRLAGVVVSVLATVVTAVLELTLTRLRLGGYLIWVAVPAAVLLNYGLAWFATTTVGRRWALGPPWALWTAIMLFAAGVRTPEGDFLLGGNDWVGLLMILAGSMTFAVYAYRMILRGPTVTKQ